MTTENKSQFAKRINRVPSYVTELIANGRIVLTADGKRVEVEASLEKIAATASGANPAVEARHAASRKADKTNKLADENPEQGSRAKFKGMVLHYENQTLKIDMMLRRNLRFQKADMRREAQAIGNTMRASLERLIYQTAPRLAVMQSRASRAELIHTEIKNLQRLIKAEFPRALRRLQIRKANG